VLAHLIKRFRGLLIVAGMAAVVNGLANVWLLSLINHFVTAPSARTARGAWHFAAAVLALSISQIVMYMLFELLSQKALTEVRTRLTSLVMSVELAHLEAVGAKNVEAALGEHSTRLAEFFVQLPILLTNSILILGCITYMAMLSVPATAVAGTVILLGAIGYFLAQSKALGRFRSLARVQAELHEHFRAILNGGKELRLNRPKRDSFARDLLGRDIERARRERVAGMWVFHLAAGWGRFLVFALLGLVIFAPFATVQIMTGFALVLVFMMNPLQTLLSSIPEAGLARVASQQIDAVAQGLRYETPLSDTSFAAAPLRRIGLRSVTYRYSRNEENASAPGRAFNVGPIDLNLIPGEITFLVGGNGSGKTTWVKLLVGLYAPEHGQVWWNDSPVGEGEREAYRQCFSAVFCDSHLFLHVAGVGQSDLDIRANRLLQRLQLDDKVSVRDGAFSTRALSQGQRKRLALLVALLEDRPCLVFDEWAADQDPEFKEVFYREILPELKAAGKLVVVISHDDRYFGVADRLVRMEDGRQILVTQASSQATATVGLMPATKEFFA
jgi:putative ATP-binding cassette transporter